MENKCNCIYHYYILLYRFTARCFFPREENTKTIKPILFYYYFLWFLLLFLFIPHWMCSCLSKEINYYIIMYFGGRVSVGFCVIWPGNMIHDEKKYQPWIVFFFLSLSLSLSKSVDVATIQWLHENCRFQAVSKTEEKKLFEFNRIVTDFGLYACHFTPI